MGFKAVIEIGGVVSEFVGGINQLGFERWLLVKKILSQFGILGPIVGT